MTLRQTASSRPLSLMRRSLWLRLRTKPVEVAGNNLYLLAVTISASYRVFIALTSWSIPSMPVLMVVQAALAEARMAR